MYPLRVPDQFIPVAIDWHGGQTSALYSVSSTGYIHDNGYRLQLEGELRSCKDPDVAEFLQWVESLPVEEDTWTVDSVKKELPDVNIQWNGLRWRARVTGRLNAFACVSPFWRLDHEGQQAQIIGPCFEFAWATIANALNNKNDLKCD